MAKIVTVTNLLTGQPAQVDQLDHTAQQIDDGVKRALEYGLGGNVVEAPFDSEGFADANLITETGFYRAFRNVPIGGWNYIIHVEYMSGTSFQIGFYGKDSIISIRRKLNQVWQPWEYINPPMVAGREYRTTERWNEIPVFAKVVDCGKLANGQSKFEHGIENVSNVIRYQGIRNGFAMPAIHGSSLTNAWTYYVASADETAITFYAGESAAGGNASCILWYTKTTY